jgi:hypothetical protein
MAGSIVSVSPEAAIAELLECVVVAYTFDRPRDRFLFVSDAPTPTRGDRRFVALAFGEVSAFVRIPASVRPCSGTPIGSQRTSGPRRSSYTRPGWPPPPRAADGWPSASARRSET